MAGSIALAAAKRSPTPGPESRPARRRPNRRGSPRPPPPARCGNGRRSCPAPRGPAGCRRPGRSSRSSLARPGAAPRRRPGSALTQASSTRSNGPFTAPAAPPGSNTSPTRASTLGASGEPAAGIEARRQRTGAGQADGAAAAGGCRTGRNSWQGCAPSRRYRSQGEIDQPGRDRRGRAAARAAGETVRRTRD